MSRADDRLRVVTLAVVDQQILAGTVEAIALQEAVLAEAVVLPDRLEDSVAGDVIERHSQTRSPCPTDECSTIRTFGLPSDDLTELRGRRPRRLGVDHAMAVGAEQSQVADTHTAFAGLMQRNYVMALDVASTTLTVSPLEVEPARRAGQRFTAPSHAFDLPAAQAGAPLAVSMDAEEIAPLHLALALIADLVGEVG